MPQRYYYYQGFGEATNDGINVQNPGGGIVVESGKSPFYNRSDPAAEMIKAIQKAVGAPVSGQWSPETHAALWAWIMAREVVTGGPTGEVSDLPRVLPYKLTVCESDGFPPSSWTSESGCVDTAWLISQLLEDLNEDSTFIDTLGYDSIDELNADPGWQAVKDEVQIDFIAKIQAALTEAVPPPMVVPPTPPGTVPPAATPVKKASLGWILLAVVGGGVLIYVASRGNKPKYEER